MMKRLFMVVLMVLLISACRQAGPTPTQAPATQVAAATLPPPTATTAPAPTATAAPVATVAPVRTLYPAPTIPIKATLVATEVSPLGYVHEYYVDSWFDNPNPRMGEKTTLSASLLHNGMWTGGYIWFHWVQDGEPQTFESIVIYQRGILTIPVTGFEPGVYVPITYTFEYLGKRFTGYTGFTPRP